MFGLQYISVGWDPLSKATITSTLVGKVFVVSILASLDVQPHTLSVRISKGLSPLSYWICILLLMYSIYLYAISSSCQKESFVHVHKLFCRKIFHRNFIKYSHTYVVVAYKISIDFPIANNVVVNDFIFFISRLGCVMFFLALGVLSLVTFVLVGFFYGYFGSRYYWNIYGYVVFAHMFFAPVWAFELSLWIVIQATMNKLKKGINLDRNKDQDDVSSAQGFSTNV